ncbi:MAG: Gfo/Idh/MocA family oxidoreductase [Candidatus Omnitrophota bacterium]|nr:Gfo/Idh/MocA family oxidoreductase [Candidatus Omnitrophota bacterium]
MVKVGIIGCGHWGPNYARCFNKLKNTTVAVCCDLKDDNLSRMKSLFGEVEVTKDYRDILKNSEISAVVVATSATTHYSIIKDCLECGKDVLAEKPLTLVPAQSLELAVLAESKNLILMVGHTFLYNTGIRKLREFIDNGELGKIYYINATRTHLGLIREDVNAVWDLTPHDVSIFNYLTGSLPVSVSAVGAAHLKKGREDVAFINLVYPDNIIANIHVSWADTNKERTIRLVGSNARAVFNDLDNLEKVKLYKKGISVSQNYDDFGEFQLLLRDGDIISPRIEIKEPLKEQCSHFLECVTKRLTPFSDARNGFDVVKVMSSIERSLKNNGALEVIDKEVVEDKV